MHSYLLILLLSTCGTVFAASLDSSVLDRRATCKGVPSMYNDTVRKYSRESYVARARALRLRPD